MYIFLYVISIFLLAFITIKIRDKREKKKQILKWQNTLDIEKLITDENLKAEANNAWKYDFNTFLNYYISATKKLKIQASSDIHIMKQILDAYPPYLKSEVSSKIKFVGNYLEYTFVNESKTRRLTIQITTEQRLNPYFYNHNNTSKYYYYMESWDY